MVELGVLQLYCWDWDGTSRRFNGLSLTLSHFTGLMYAVEVDEYQRDCSWATENSEEKDKYEQWNNSHSMKTRCKQVLCSIFCCHAVAELGGCPNSDCLLHNLRPSIGDSTFSPPEHLLWPFMAFLPTIPWQGLLDIAFREVIFIFQM